MKAIFIRILFNTVALVIAVCLIAIVNKFLQEYSEVCSVSIGICALVFFFEYNRPSATTSTKKQFDAVLANICVVTSNIIIYIDEFLIDEGVLFTTREPVEIDEDKHPVIFFEEFVDNVLERTPKSLSEEVKDYSKLAEKLKDKAKLLYLQINSNAMAASEDTALQKKIRKVYQAYSNFEKMLCSGEISQKELYEELKPLLKSSKELCQLIKTNYPKEIKKYKPKN